MFKGYDAYEYEIHLADTSDSYDKSGSINVKKRTEIDSLTSTLTVGIAEEH